MSLWFPFRAIQQGSSKNDTLPPHLFGACRALTSAQVLAPRRDLEANRREASAWATFGSCLFLDLFVACRVIPFTNKPMQPKGTTLENTNGHRRRVTYYTNLLGSPQSNLQGCVLHRFFRGPAIYFHRWPPCSVGFHWPEGPTQHSVQEGEVGKMAFGLFRGGVGGAHRASLRNKWLGSSREQPHNAGRPKDPQLHLIS